MTDERCALCGAGGGLTEVVLSMLCCKRCAERAGPQPWRDVVREVIDILSQTRHTFRSKQVERARRLLLGLVEKEKEKQQ